MNKILFTIIISNIFVAHFAFAAGYTPLAPIPGYVEAQVGNDLNGYLNAMFKLGISLAVGLAVIMIIIGGIQYMSTDAMGKKNDGKSRITAAIVGLLVALGSYMLLNTLDPNLLKTELTLQSVNGGAIPGRPGPGLELGFERPTINDLHDSRNTLPYTPQNPRDLPQDPSQTLDPRDVPPPSNLPTPPVTAPCTEDIGMPDQARIDQGGYTYQGNGNIDYDGDPRAYAIPGSGQTGLDYLQNTTSAAGRVVNVDRNPDGTPVNNGGFYVSQTSHTINGHYLNSSQIPYVAMPRGYHGAQLGDYVLITNPNNGRQAWAIFGDYTGGSTNGVEMSPAAANLIGMGFVKRGTTSNDKNIKATVFPNSKHDIPGGNCH